MVRAIVIGVLMVPERMKRGSLVRGWRLGRYLRCDGRLHANMIKRVRGNIWRLGRNESHEQRQTRKQT
jgi:hypothetical protein